MQAHTKYIPALDGLRAIAIFFVMLGHSVQQHPLSNGLVVDRGGLGVDIFFVLSGYLITNILLCELSDNGSISLRHFYIRRFLRLFPAMLMLVLAYLIISPFILQQTFSARILTSMAVITYTMNWVKAFGLGGGGILAHTWSLSIEEQFYIMWPVTLIALIKCSSLRFAAAFSIIIALVSLAWSRYLYIHGATSDRIYNGLDTHLHSILIGCSLALYFFLSRPKIIKSRLISLKSICATLIIFYIMIYGTSPAVRDISQLLLSISTAIVIWGILNEEILIKYFLEVSIMCMIGRISYGLYLWHYPVFTIMHMNRISELNVLIYGSMISLSIAVISYLTIERYFLLLKDKFRHPLTMYDSR